MNQLEVINTLRAEVNENPVTSAVLHMFAQRKRARHMVTLRGLSLRMEREGFNYSKAEYAKVLTTLASLGFGKVEKDPKGNVLALKDVKVTLQSLGAAVLGQQTKLKAYAQRNKYSAVGPVAEIVKSAPSTLKVYPYRVSSSISITVTINGKPIIVPLPNGLTAEEIAGLISHFQSKSDQLEPPSPSSTGKQSS